MSDKLRGDNSGQYRAATASATFLCPLPGTRSANLSQVDASQSANACTTLYGVQKHDSSGAKSVSEKRQASVPRHSNDDVRSELEMAFQKRLRQPKKKFPKEAPDASTSADASSKPPSPPPPQQANNVPVVSVTVSSAASVPSPSPSQPQKHSHFSPSSPPPPPRSSSLHKTKDITTTNSQSINIGIPGYRRVTTTRGVRTPRSFNQDFSDFTDSEDCRTPDVSIFNMSEGYRTPLESEDEADTASKHSYAASSTRFPFKSEIVKQFEKPVPVFMKCQSWCNQLPDETEPRQPINDPNLSKELQNIESFESAMLDWFQTLNRTNDDDDLRSETSVSSMGSCKSEYRLRSLINNRFQNSQQIETVLTDLLAISDKYAQATDTESVVSESQKSVQTLKLQKASQPRRGRATVIRRSSIPSDASGSESESEPPRQRGGYKSFLSELQGVLRQRRPIPDAPDSEESGLGSSEYSNPPTSPLSPTSVPPTLPKPQFPKVHAPKAVRTAQVTHKPLVNSGDFKYLLGELSTAWSKRLKRIRKAQMVSQRGMQSSLYANFQGFRIPETLIEDKSTKYANFQGKLEPAEIVNPETRTTIYKESELKSESVSKPMFCKIRGQDTEKQVLPSEIAKKESVPKSQKPTEPEPPPTKEMTGQELLESVQKPGVKKTTFRMNKYIRNVASGGVLPEISEEASISSPSQRKLVSALNKGNVPVPTSDPRRVPSASSGQVDSRPQVKSSPFKSPQPPDHIQSASPAVQSPLPSQVSITSLGTPVFSRSSTHIKSPPPSTETNSAVSSTQENTSQPKVRVIASLPQHEVWSPPSRTKRSSTTQIKPSPSLQETTVKHSSPSCAPPQTVRSTFSPPPPPPVQVRAPPQIPLPPPPPVSETIISPCTVIKAEPLKHPLPALPHSRQGSAFSIPPQTVRSTFSPPPPVQVRAPPKIPIPSPPPISETLVNNAVSPRTDIKVEPLKHPRPTLPHSRQESAFSIPAQTLRSTHSSSEPLEVKAAPQIPVPPPPPPVSETLVSPCIDIKAEPLKHPLPVLPHSRQGSAFSIPPRTLRSTHSSSEPVEIKAAPQIPISSPSPMSETLVNTVIIPEPSKHIVPSLLSHDRQGSAFTVPPNRNPNPNSNPNSNFSGLTEKIDKIKAENILANSDPTIRKTILDGVTDLSDQLKLAITEVVKKTEETLPEDNAISSPCFTSSESVALSSKVSFVSQRQVRASPVVSRSVTPRSACMSPALIEEKRQILERLSKIGERNVITKEELPELPMDIMKASTIKIKPLVTENIHKLVRDVREGSKEGSPMVDELRHWKKSEVVMELQSSGESPNQSDLSVDVDIPLVPSEPDVSESQVGKSTLSLKTIDEAMETSIPETCSPAIDSVSERNYDVDLEKNVGFFDTQSVTDENKSETTHVSQAVLDSIIETPVPENDPLVTNLMPEISYDVDLKNKLGFLDNQSVTADENKPESNMYHVVLDSQIEIPVPENDPIVTNLMPEISYDVDLKNKLGFLDNQSVCADENKPDSNMSHVLDSQIEIPVPENDPLVTNQLMSEISYDVDLKNKLGFLDNEFVTADENKPESNMSHFVLDSQIEIPVPENDPIVTNLMPEISYDVNLRNKLGFLDNEFVTSDENKPDSNMSDVVLDSQIEIPVPENDPIVTNLMPEISYDVDLKNKVEFLEHQFSVADENTELDSLMKTVLLNLETMDRLLPDGERQAEKDPLTVSEDRPSRKMNNDSVSFPVSLPECTSLLEVQENGHPTTESSTEFFVVTPQENESLEKTETESMEEYSTDVKEKDSEQTLEFFVKESLSEKNSEVFEEPTGIVEFLEQSNSGETETCDVSPFVDEKDFEEAVEVSVGENAYFNGDDVSYSIVFDDSEDTRIPSEEELESLWINPVASHLAAAAGREPTIVKEGDTMSAEEVIRMDIHSDVAASVFVLEAPSTEPSEFLAVIDIVEDRPDLETVGDIMLTDTNPESLQDWSTIPDAETEKLILNPGDVSTAELQTPEALSLEEVSNYNVISDNITNDVTVPSKITESAQLSHFIPVFSPIEPEMLVLENPPDVIKIPVQEVEPTITDAGAFVEISGQKEILFAPSEQEERPLLTNDSEMSLDQLKQSIKEEMLKSADITKIFDLENLKSFGPNGSPDDHEYEDAVCYSSDDSLTFEDTLTSPLMSRRVYKEVVRAEIGSRVETLQSWATPEPLKSWPNQENLQLCSGEDLVEDSDLHEFCEAEEIVSNTDGDALFDSDQQQLVYTLPTIYEATEESVDEERRILREINHVDQLIGECVETLEMSPVELAQVQEQDKILCDAEIPDFIAEIKSERDGQLDSVLANLKSGAPFSVGCVSSNEPAALFGELKRSQGLTALDQICIDQSPESQVQEGSPPEKISDHTSPEIFSDDEMLNSIPYNVTIEKPELFEDEILPAMSTKTIFDKMGVGKIYEDNKFEASEDEISPAHTRSEKASEDEISPSYLRSEKTSEDEEEGVENWIQKTGQTDLELPRSVQTQQPLADKFENLLEYLESDAARELQEFERIESACEILSKDHRKDSVVSNFSVGTIGKSDDFELLIRSLDSELEEDMTQKVLANPDEDLVPGVVMVPENVEQQDMNTFDYEIDPEDRVDQIEADPDDTSAFDDTCQDYFFDAYSETEYLEYMLSRDPEDSGYIDAVPVYNTVEIESKQMMLLEKSTIQDDAASPYISSSQMDEGVDEDDQNDIDSNYLSYMREREMETYELMTAKNTVISDMVMVSSSVDEKSTPHVELVLTVPESEQEHETISEDIFLAPASSIEADEQPLFISDEIEEEFFTIKGTENTVEKAFEYLLSSKTLSVKENNDTSPDLKTDHSLSLVENSSSVSEEKAFEYLLSSKTLSVKENNDPSPDSNTDHSLSLVENSSSVSEEKAFEYLLLSVKEANDDTSQDPKTGHSLSLVENSNSVSEKKAFEYLLSSNMLSVNEDNNDTSPDPKTDHSLVENSSSASEDSLSPGNYSVSHADAADKLPEIEVHKLDKPPKKHARKNKKGKIPKEGAVGLNGSAEEESVTSFCASETQVVDADAIFKDSSSAHVSRSKNDDSVLSARESESAGKLATKTVTKTRLPSTSSSSTERSASCEHLVPPPGSLPLTEDVKDTTTATTTTTGKKKRKKKKKKGKDKETPTDIEDIEKLNSAEFNAETKHESDIGVEIVTETPENEARDGIQNGSKDSERIDSVEEFSAKDRISELPTPSVAVPLPEMSSEEIGSRPLASESSTLKILNEMSTEKEVPSPGLVSEPSIVEESALREMPTKSSESAEDVPSSAIAPSLQEMPANSSESAEEISSLIIASALQEISTFSSKSVEELPASIIAPSHQELPAIDSESVKELPASMMAPSCQEVPAINSESVKELPASIMAPSHQEVPAINSESVKELSASMMTPSLQEVPIVSSESAEDVSSSVSALSLEERPTNSLETAEEVSFSVTAPALQETPGISLALADTVSSSIIASALQEMSTMSSESVKEPPASIMAPSALQEISVISSEVKEISSEKQDAAAGELSKVTLSSTLESLNHVGVFQDQDVSSAASSNQSESFSKQITYEINDSTQPVVVVVPETSVDVSTLPVVSPALEHPTPTIPHLKATAEELDYVTSLEQPAPVPPTLPSTTAPVPPTLSSTTAPVPPTLSSTTASVPPTLSSTTASVPPTLSSTTAPVPPTLSSTSTPVPQTSSSSSSSVAPPLSSSSSSQQPAPSVPSSPPPPKQCAPVATLTASPLKGSTRFAPLLSSTPRSSSLSSTNRSSSLSSLSNRECQIHKSGAKCPLKIIEHKTDFSESYQKKAAFLANPPRPIEYPRLYRCPSSEARFGQPPPVPCSLRDMEPPPPPVRKPSKDNVVSDLVRSPSGEIGAPLSRPEDTTLECSTNTNRNGVDNRSPLNKSPQIVPQTNSPSKRFRDLKHFSRISNMTYNEVIELEEEEHRRRYDYGTGRRLREMKYFGRICHGDSEESMISKKSESSDSGILTGYRDLKQSRTMTTSSTSLQSPGISAAGGRRPKGLTDSAVSIDDNHRQFEPVMSYVAYGQSGDANATEVQQYSSSVSGRSNTLQPSDRHRQDMSGYGQIQKTHDMVRSTQSLDYHAGRSKFIRPEIGLSEQDVTGQGFQDSGLCASNCSVSGHDSDDTRSMRSSVSFVIPEHRTMENIVMDDDSESIYEDVAMYPSSDTMSLRSDVGSVKSLSKLKKFGSKLKKFSKIKFKKFWK